MTKHVLITAVTGFTLMLLSACASPPAANPPTNQPADLPLAHLQEAAAWYNRYHALVLRQVYLERSRRTQDRLPDDMLSPSARLRTGLKRLAEVCAALEQAGGTRR